MSQNTAIEAHRQLLSRWRQAMDLIGPGPMEPHFQDAIGVCTDLQATGRWIDLGAGAGFPGIALAALHPGADVTLIESRQKRVIFLKKVLRESGLKNMQIVQTRTEKLDELGCYDGVISRAYKPPLLFLEDAARLLRPGGRAVMMLGDDKQLSQDTLPAGWCDPQIYRYRVADGWRIRQVICWSP